MISSQEIKEIRERLGASVREFDAYLGYLTDGRTTMALEAGTRNGKPFEITGPAYMALRRLLAIKRAYDAPDEARQILGAELPEKLKAPVELGIGI